MRIPTQLRDARAAYLIIIGRIIDMLDIAVCRPTADNGTSFSRLENVAASNSPSLPRALENCHYCSRDG